MKHVPRYPLGDCKECDTYLGGGSCADCATWENICYDYCRKCGTVDPGGCGCWEEDD